MKSIAIHPFALAALLFSIFSVQVGLADTQVKTLTEQLKAKASSSAEKTPFTTQQIMDEAIDNLRKSRVTERALTMGKKMPPFSLPNARGKIIDSNTLLKKGPLIVTFYRGGWCPYCNLQLRDLQSHLGEIQRLGSDLIAISPQTPDNSLSTTEKSNLKFHVLSDKDNQVAREFGLVFKLPDSLKKVYQDFGIDLTTANGANSWELPVSATYIVGKNGRIQYAFVDVDYKNRAETNAILKQLRMLQKR